MELLIFNADTGLNDVNWKDLVDYDEFKALYALNYNKQAGDIDGRKRVRATKEIKYLKSFYDPMSAQNRKGLSKEEKLLDIASMYNLPLNFEESEELIAAKNVYIQNFEFVAYKLLKSTRNVIIQYISSLDDIHKKQKEFSNNKEVTEEGLKAAVENGKYIITLVKELPNALTSLQDLEEKIANNQLGSTTSVFGDAIPSRFEDTRTKK